MEGGRSCSHSQGRSWSWSGRWAGQRRGAEPTLTLCIAGVTLFSDTVSLQNSIPRAFWFLKLGNTEQLWNTEKSDSGAWEDGGNKCHWPDTYGDLPSRIKEENGETDQRRVALSLVQCNVLSEALSKLLTSPFHWGWGFLRLSSGFPFSFCYGGVS